MDASKTSSLALGTVSIVVAWYAVSVLCICTSKVILERLPAPGLLCFYQSCVSAAAAWVAMRLTGAKPYFAEQLPYLIGASLTYALNLAFTNVSFLKGSAPLTETIKSTEPVIVSLLAMPLLGEKLTVTGLFAVFCISAGTAIACISDTLVITFGGSIFAVIAVFCQGASSICIKLLNLVPLPVAQLNLPAPDVDVEAMVSPRTTGLVSAESYESQQLSHRVPSKDADGKPGSPTSGKKPATSARVMTDVEKIFAAPAVVERRPIHPATLFFNVSLWSMAISGIYSMLVGESSAWDFVQSLSGLLLSNAPPAAPEFDTLTTLGLLTLNALCFATYNLAAYIVLRMTSATNYSVLNSLRRVIVILVSTFVFSLDFTVLSLVGIAVAFVGFTSHTYRDSSVSVYDCVGSVHNRLAKAQYRAA